VGNLSSHRSRSQVEPSQVEQSQVERSQVEQSQVEQSQVEQSQVRRSTPRPSASGLIFERKRRRKIQEKDSPPLDSSTLDDPLAEYAIAERPGAAFSPKMAKPLVGIIMGSTSDWETMQHAAAQLDALGVPYERRVVSAHRTPKLMVEYAETAERRGLRVIIAGAGGAAHLPGMTASLTTLPVLGVPMESHSLKGMDSLLSIVQMPAGVPVATFAIGKAGAINAALFAASLVAQFDVKARSTWRKFRTAQTERVLRAKLP
jgi:5-(carboxyamino)imidazole ribonucleotide mutase